jgi:CRISPR-associated protein Cmr3
MSYWSTLDNPLLFQAPQNVKQALNKAKRVKMMLASPGIFKGGWKPGWLDHNNIGTVPETEVRLKLVGYCGERWQPISGWSMEHRGAKPIRRMVPAGAVYFFEVEDGNALQLSNKWLKSVSSNVQSQSDQDDGFSLSLWGVWEHNDQ